MQAAVNMATVQGIHLPVFVTESAMIWGVVAMTLRTSALKVKFITNKST